MGKLKFWPPARGDCSWTKETRKMLTFQFLHEQASLSGLCSKGCYIIFSGGQAKICLKNIGVNRKQLHRGVS